MELERHGSGTPWEAAVGYSRVIRAGAHVWVAGCTATSADGIVLARGDAYQQTIHTLENVERALALVGATLVDVVRTRISVTDITRWEEIGRAHGEVFGQARPVTAMVQVTGFIDPLMLVEIETDAYVVAPPAGA